MASCITSQFGNSYCPQVRLTASVTSNTNTSATISWELEWITHGYTISSSQSKSYSVKIGGTTVKSGSFAYGGKTSRTIASGTRTITKTTSSQSITCSFTFAMTFNWNGTTGKSQTKSCTVTVSAKPKYTISYNANGGSGAPSSQTKWYGTNIKLSSTKPTRTGYTFQGWGTSASGSVVYAPGATYSTNASDTLYAIWKIITYTVSYNANGGSGAPSSQTKNYGSSIKLSTTKPTRTNYNFKGWATSASGSVVYASGATYSNNANITLYAVWELAYTPPSISSLKVSRCESDGTSSETGTYAKVTFSWSCSQLIGSNPVTSIVIKWGTGSQSTVSTSGNSGSVSHIIGTFDADKSYTITVVVADSKNGSSSSSVVLPTAAFYLDFKAAGSGVAIGKVAETADLLDVGYESRFRKQINTDDRVFITSYGNTLQLGASNETYTHIYSNKPYAFNNDFALVGKPSVGTDVYPAVEMIIDCSSGSFAGIANSGDKVNLIWLLASGNVVVGGGTDSKAPKTVYIRTKGQAHEQFLASSDSDGDFIRSETAYHRTYSYSANMYITSYGTIGRCASSSKKYKKDIISIEENLNKPKLLRMSTSENDTETESTIDPRGLYDIPVMQYKYIDNYLVKEDGHYGKDVVGIMAEDVAENYPAAAIFDKDGNPEAWDKDAVLVGLLYLVQQQKKEIDELKQRLSNMEE